LRIRREREGKEVRFIPTGWFTYFYSTSLKELLSANLNTEEEDNIVHEKN
jgi:hypothetical protein